MRGEIVVPQAPALLLGSSRPSMEDAERLSEVIGSIYQGVTESAPWSGVLHTLLDMLGALHVTLILSPPTPQSPGIILNTDTVSQQGTASYNSHFFALDPFVHLPKNEIVVADDLLGRRWLESPLYREFLKPADVRYVLGSDIHTDDGVECRFRVSRSHDAPPFGAREQMLCRVLLPHLRRAIQLHTRIDYLECERQLFAGTMNRMRLGVINFARDGSVHEINAEARRILGENDGISLLGKNLMVSRNPENRELQALIRQAISGSGESKDPSVATAMSITRPSGRTRLGVVVRSVPSAVLPDSFVRPAAALFLRDPESSGLPASHELVRRLFGFTRMETELALWLAEGLTIEEASEKMGVTRNTGRTYLRFIFAKTGVTRQSMLVRLLLNSVAALGDDSQPWDGGRGMLGRPS